MPSKSDVHSLASDVPPASSTVENSININSPKTTIQNVTIYDIGGRTVYEVNSTEALNVQIDASTLEAAMYFVKVSTTEGFIIKQIIKQ